MWDRIAGWELMDLFGRAEMILAEIEQIFVDAAHWNQHVRNPSEAPIDPDPEGKLEAAREWLRSFIAQAPAFARLR